MVNAYPDTSFLFSLYAPQAHSRQAAAQFAAMKEPLHITSLNRFELVTAIQLCSFRKVIPRSTGLLALKMLDENIAEGALVIVPCDWAAVHGRALKITTQHTATGGHRGFDILHIATALELGAKEFLTFDVTLRRLARAVGLNVKL